MDKYEAKSLIIDAFKHNVLGTKPSDQELNLNHDGAEGHWLEVRLGKSPDASNEADFWGYECKKGTRSKVSWGDWTANYRIFCDMNYFPNSSIGKNQTEFVRIFGQPNPNKGNRFAWCSPNSPRYCGVTSDHGHDLSIDENLDIILTYSYSKDQRANKFLIVPSHFQKENLLIMKWFGTHDSFKSYKDRAQSDPNILFHPSQTSLQSKVENKFGIYGWFKCLKDREGIYEKIEFGDSLSYLEWLKHVEDRNIYFDSGKREDSTKPYESWRSDNRFWRTLVTSVYP